MADKKVNNGLVVVFDNNAVSFTANASGTYVASTTTGNGNFAGTTWVTTTDSSTPYPFAGGGTAAPHPGWVKGGTTYYPLNPPAQPYAPIIGPNIFDPDPDVREVPAGPIVLDATAMLDALEKWQQFFQEILDELDDDQDDVGQILEDAAWAMDQAQKALEKLGQR